MTLFPANADDLLDVAALPPTDDTELNYRTRPLSPAQELRLTLLVLFVPVPILVALSAIHNGFIALHVFFLHLTVATAILLGGSALLRHLVGATLRSDMTALVVLAAAFLCGRLWTWVDGVWWCRLALLLSWIVSAVIARQVAAWILVGPTVDHDTMERWRFNLPAILHPRLSLECPELLTFTLSGFVLGPAWWVAARLATDSFGRIWLWPLGFVVCLHIGWLLLHVITCLFVPWPSWERSWRITLQAVVLFLTYDPHQTPAAGVFRFPARWLRPIAVRWGLVVAVLMALAFACSTSCPDAVAAWSQGRSLLGQLMINLILVSVEAPLLFVTILWLTAGSLLARFDAELSGTAEDGPTEWDNYVDRIINSNDKLESEHLLAGFSRTGDYPVLIHREIYTQHMHLLGDSGASKTSLGMAPTATQLIARGDATVVIVDLKGDKALFEACRLEAARTGNMRFRWVSNEVGHSSYSFNPFLQSHNQSLSVEQFVQEILQGLSLDHGIAYGAGYFTAMNEIVLTNVLKNCRARSFRELDRYLSDQRFYARVGHAEDWAQARHLGSLVSRMAATESINVVPGMYPDQPNVQTESIDACNVFAEPQVVYLWLRSAIEPSNAPAIARLFLWSMFNAASHNPPGKNRVYFFIDEFQQVISEGIRLIFEQFRDLGGTLIAAHQTAGQLRRQGSDLGETIDSCTAVKQVFRASGLESLERLEKLAGKKLDKVAYWMQPKETTTGNLIDRLDMYHAVDGLLNVRLVEQPRLNRQQLLEISSSRMASLIRFTFGSGYTQFAGATVPIVSTWPIRFREYERRRDLSWPKSPGAFSVPAVPMKSLAPTTGPDGPRKTGSRGQSEAFVEEFERRGKPNHRRRT